MVYNGLVWKGSFTDPVIVLAMLILSFLCKCESIRICAFFLAEPRHIVMSVPSQEYISIDFFVCYLTEVGIGVVVYILDCQCFAFNIQFAHVYGCISFLKILGKKECIYVSVNIFKVQWNIWSVHSWLVSCTCIERYVS